MLIKDVPQRLWGKVQALRIRVTTSESKLKAPREQAVLAKRRRKEAKRLAQQAKKRLRHSKAALAELRLGLARAEAKFVKLSVRGVTRKPAKARRRRLAKAIPGDPGTKAVPVRKKRPVSAARPPSLDPYIEANLEPGPARAGGVAPTWAT